jgi:hypothetical protein
MEDDTKFLRVNVQGVWRSICKICFRITATADHEAGLNDAEDEHKCPGKFTLPRTSKTG